jgi:hypothetical protein
MPAPTIRTDKCWVTISKLSTGATTSTNVEYGAKTSDITIGGGNGDLDVIRVNTGDIEKLNRQDPFEISFDNIVPLYAYDFRQMKEGGAVTTGLYTTSAGTDRGQFRVAMLWTNQTGVTSAAQAITGSSTITAYRCVVRDARCTELEEKWAAGEVLGGTIKFKVPAIDATGGGNVQWSSIDGAQTLGALTTYTGGNFA